MRLLFYIFLLLYCAICAGDITFKVDDVKLSEEETELSDISQKLPFKFKGKIEAYKVPFEKLSISPINSFVNAIKVAYDKHLKLEINPDDIWLLICQGVSIHINENYASMKSLILKDDTKQTYSLRVRRDDFIKGQNNPWEEVVSSFAKQVSDNTKNELLQLFVPSFSTTSPEIKTVFEMTLLKTTDCYFEYNLDTLCGIPEIILKGTPKDWLALKQKIYAIDKFNLSWWTRELHPIIDEFIRASEGKPNIEFWKKILKDNYNSGQPLYVSGWITKFFPYLVSNADKFYKNPYINTSVPEPGFEANIFPKGIAHTRFMWHYYDKFHDMEMCSGFIGINVDGKKVTRPAIGWVIKEYTPPVIIKGIRGNNAGKIFLTNYLLALGMTLVFMKLTLANQSLKKKILSLSSIYVIKLLVFLVFLIFFYWFYNCIFSSSYTYNPTFLQFLMGKTMSLALIEYVSIPTLIFEYLVSVSLIILILFPYSNIKLNIIATSTGVVIWFIYLTFFIEKLLVLYESLE